MPGGDRTGPMGMGPMTGRGMGFCGSYGQPGWKAPGPGYGYGRGRWGGGLWQGRGVGWGWRHWYHATGLPRAWMHGYPVEPPSLSREQEIDMLRDEAEWLKEQLDAINRRMDELNQE